MEWRVFHLFPYRWAEGLKPLFKTGKNVGISRLCEMILWKKKKKKKTTCLSGVSECSDFKLSSSSWLCCSLSPATRIAKWWLQTVDRVLLCGFRFLDLSSSSPGHCVLFCFFFPRGQSKSVTGQKCFGVKKNFVSWRKQKSGCECTEPVGMGEK